MMGVRGDQGVMNNRNNVVRARREERGWRRDCGPTVLPSPFFSGPGSLILWTHKETPCLQVTQQPAANLKGESDLPLGSAFCSCSENAHKPPGPKTSNS